jgi:lysozyme
MIDEALPIIESLCVRFEGVYLQPYACPAGVATIGVGTTRYLDGSPVRLSDPPITREQAMALLRAQLRTVYIPQTLDACPGIDTPERLAAIADFCYNCGAANLRASTLRRRVNAGAWDDVPAQLLRWVFAAGKRLRGLERRRAAEAALI